MRATITLDDDTAALVEMHMRRRGVALNQVVNEALREALGERRPFRTTVYDMGEPTVSLDRALALAADLEDAEIVRRMTERDH